MKKHYFAVTEEYEGHYFAYAMGASDADNLLALFARQAGIATLVAAHACGSRKQAEEIAEGWNESFRKNGTYLYSYMY